MKDFALTFCLCLVILLALDFVWLSLTGDRLYRPAMVDLMRATPNLIPAAIFYLLYAFAMTYLVLYPVLYGGPDHYSLLDLSIRAGLLGLVAYGTYNLTALSVIRDWPMTLSLIDMGWGVGVSVLAANATALALKAMGQLN
jgi:uncharacterized membrane protein